MATALIDDHSTPDASDSERLPHIEPAGGASAPQEAPSAQAGGLKNAPPERVDQLETQLRNANGQTQAMRGELQSLRRMLKAERMVRREVEQKMASAAQPEERPADTEQRSRLQQQLTRLQQQLAAQRRAFEAGEAARTSSEAARLATQAELEAAQRKLSMPRQADPMLQGQNQQLQKALDLAADELAGLEIRAESAEKETKTLYTLVQKGRTWKKRLFFLGALLGLAAGAAGGWFAQGLL